VLKKVKHKKLPLFDKESIALSTIFAAYSTDIIYLLSRLPTYMSPWTNEL
jgi:hypothetical protein